MSTTKQDLLDLVDVLVTKREALTAAHGTTVAAEQNVTSVTVIEQAKIDAATAHFDQATTEAKQEAVEAHASEDNAAVEDQTAFDALIAAISDFNTGT
jgi:hypothetical protein